MTANQVCAYSGLGLTGDQVGVDERPPDEPCEPKAPGGESL